MELVFNAPLHLDSLRRPVLDVTRTVNHLAVMAFNVFSKHYHSGVKVVLRFWVRVETMFNRFALLLVESEKKEHKMKMKSESYIKREIKSESYEIISDGK